MKKKRRKIRINRLIMLFLFIFLFCFCFIVFIRSDFFCLKNIDVVNKNKIIGIDYSKEIK